VCIIFIFTDQVLTYHSAAIEQEMKDLRTQVANHKEHLKALENGETFVSRLTQKTKNGKKRKNKRNGKNGSPKRHRGDVSDNDSDGEFVDSDEESSESGVDSDSSHDDSETDSNMASGDENDEVMDEDVTEASLQAKIEECNTTLKDARTRHSQARKERKEASDAIVILEKELKMLQRKKNAFCSLKRSEVRVSDFR
jgi:hypothetical protein